MSDGSMYDDALIFLRAIQRARSELATAVGVPLTSITFSHEAAPGETTISWTLPISSPLAALVMTGSNPTDEKPQTSDS